MPVPKVYRTTAEKFILSFNFTDAASGTGYLTTYGCGTSADDKLLITNNTFDADLADYVTTFTMSTGAIAKVGEINFDLTFANRAQTISGDLFINETMELRGGGSTSVQGYLKFRVLHVDTGATETEIGAQVTLPTQSVGASTNNSFRHLIKIPVSKKKFKDGEKLRIEVEFWAARSGTDSAVTIWLYHDPSSRLDASGGSPFTNATSLIVHVPFQIVT